MKLTAKNVEKVLLDCLSNDKDGLVVEGIVQGYMLNNDKLIENTESITDMLNELPKEFKEGWSFLNACNNKDGEQWTGLHQRMEELFVLGMGIKKVTCPMPKELWTALPGGVPYYQVVT